MADYVAREWSGGDIVTAANLNHIEQGIAEASSGGTKPLEVHAVKNDRVAMLDKTWQEIFDAFPNVYIVDTVDFAESGIISLKSPLVVEESLFDGVMSYIVSWGGTRFLAVATSANDYPFSDI